MHARRARATIGPASPPAAGDHPVSRFEPNLRIPGPTSLPPSVREAGARQMINHRGPEFAAMLARIQDGHEALLRDDRATSRSSRAPGRAASRRPSSTSCRRATGSWASRSARSATASPRSPRPTARRSTRSAPSGASPPAPTRSGSASEAHDYKAVLLTHNETSTGGHEPHPRARGSDPRRVARTRSSSSTASRPSGPCPSPWTTGAATWS